MTTVVVADDQELIRDGVAAILDAEPDFQVVGTAADGAEAIGLIQVARPDVALMDIRMPVVDGIEATRRLTVAGVSTRILILTTYAADEFVVDALRAGASGFLLKDAPRAALVAAVSAVAAGEVLLDASVTRRLVSDYLTRTPATNPVPSLDRLTPREGEVLALVGKGLNNAELAQTLFVSESTIKTHLARILNKLGARDRIQLVVLANVAGLV
jgi:DNA-binding NarL/FixJ family response regulator